MEYMFMMMENMSTGVVVTYIVRGGAILRRDTRDSRGW